MEKIFLPNVLYRIREANINYYKTPFVHPRRKMDEYDFIYLLEGEWTLGACGVEYPLKKDTLLILPRSVEHYGITPCSEGTRTMYFHVALPREISSPPLAEADENLCESHGESAEEGFLLPLFYPDVSEKVKKRFFDVVRSYLSGNTRKANFYFSLLLCDLEESERYSEDSKIATKIKTKIHEHPELFFSNATLARMVNVSTKTAENKFKAMYGLTIHQYILEFKIREAIAYFDLFPDISVKEVSHNLGFFDEYHFSKTFKRLKGKSPRQWRLEGM